MAEPETYDEWCAEAMAHDERFGGERWKADDRSDDYDYRVIRARYQEIQAIKASGDVHALLYYLNEGVHGNAGGIGNSALYGRARFGTKHLISAYIMEVSDALEQVASQDESVIPFATKLDFFRREARCFGRSALMLSGGGALGPFHLGVCKTLFARGLLPNVISGASAGAFVAALIGTHQDVELRRLLNAGNVAIELEELSTSSRSVLMGRRQIGLDEVLHTIDVHVPDLTFQEAFEHTGRQINIAVSPLEVNQNARLLNAITSPNVCIREAVLASCALPGLFPPVTLMARDLHGNKKPYVPSRKWIDGSFTDDLPISRLARLYGVNHSIVSQTNPLVLWALRDGNYDNLLAGELYESWQKPMQSWFRATFPMAMRAAGASGSAFNEVLRRWYGVAMQDYTADINIIPRDRFPAPSDVLAVLDEEEVRDLIREGELSTWPKVEMIANCTRIGRTIDSILERLERAAAGGVARLMEPTCASAIHAAEA